MFAADQFKSSFGVGRGENLEAVFRERLRNQLKALRIVDR